MDDEPPNVGDIDHIGFQRKKWIVERVGWVLIGVSLVAALPGLFSIGPVSETTTTSPNDTVT